MRMKKTVALLLTFCLLVCLLVPAFAESGVTTGKLGSMVEYTLNEETGELFIHLTDGPKSGPMGDFTPDSSPFSDPTKIKTVVIAPWVLSIGAYVFAGCVNLTEITIPATVTEIGAGAFQDCGDFTVRYGGSQEGWSEIELGENNGWVKTVRFTYDTLEDDPGEPDAEPTIEPKPDNLCPWCNTVHGDGFFQRIVAWFHGILARIIRK